MKKRLKFLVLLFIFHSSFLFSSNYYWVGGTGNWSDLSHWATTSGGNSFYSVLPTANDNVVFDSLSFSSTGQMVTINVSSAKCDNMDWSTTLFSPTLAGIASDTLSIFGSLIFNPFMNNGFMGDIYFLSPSSNDSVKTNGHNLNRNAFFTGSGTYNIRSSLTCFNVINLLRGTLKTNGFSVSCKNFNALSTSSRSLNLATSTITISGSGAAWDAGTTGFTLTAGTSKIVFTNSTLNTVTFNAGGAGVGYNLVNFQCPNIQLLAAGTFDSILVSAGAKFILPGSKTQSIGMLVANGTCQSPIVISSDGTSAATLSKVGASSVTCNYLRLSNINKSGAGSNFIANNSIKENGLCNNWTINPIISATTFFWIGGNGNWSNSIHWSLSSGGAPGTCIPGPGDNVVFNTSSGFASNDSVIIDKNAYCNNMTWTGALPSPRLAGIGTKLEIKGSVVFVATMTAPFTGDFKFVGNAIQTINMAGVQLNGNSYFNGAGGQWQLAGILNSSKSLILESGHLNTQNNTVTCSNFVSIAGSGRQLSLGSSIMTITGFSNAWNVAVPFILNAGTSEIIFSTTTSNVANFKGAGLTYNKLTLNNNYTSITSANTFKKLKVAAGKTLTLQSGLRQTIDTINWMGTCALPITVEASSVYDTAANISKTGDTLTTVNYVNFKNVTATTTGPARLYNATNSTSQYNTTGWTITGSAVGRKFYWTGGTGNWSDHNHWSSTSGGPSATCIPTQYDTVLFDVNSFSATGQFVNVDVDGYCKVMDWTGAGFNPKLFLIRNVIVKRKATLNPVMIVERLSRSVQLQFLPNGNNVDFDSKKVVLNTDVLFEGKNGTDTLILLNHLYLSDTTSFTMVRGTFITNNDSINAGAMSFLNTFPKTTKLGSSYIDLTYGWNAFTGGTMILNAGTSTININGHPSFDYFYGDGLTYNNVIIASPSDTNTFISGSNLFNNLTLKAGLEAKVTAATTQTIAGNFTAVGTCIDSIRIESTIGGNPIIISKASGTVTTSCMLLKDINRAGAATFNTLFSTNLGNVSGWTFTPTAPTTANFTTTYSICLGAASAFTNTSTSYLSGPMTYLWNFGDGSTSTAISPTHTYSTGGKKYVTLTSTYIASSCDNIRKDSVLVNQPFVNLSTSEGDSTICAGGQIQFDATGETGSLFQFLIDGISQGPFSAVDSVITSAITNGQVVTANVTLNGCPASSLQAYPIKVNALPTVTLNSSDADDIICSGTPITFTASGADKYEFFINGLSQGFANAVNTFTPSSISNGQVISVVGTDTSNGCNKTGVPAHTITVNAFPIPTMTCSTSNQICSGTPVIFTAAGASLYEFFVNGISQGAPGPSNIFTSNAINNGAIVTLKGTTNGCTAASFSSFTFAVTPIPSVTLTNNATANTICAGEPIIFTAGNSTLYEFFVDGISTGPASGNNTFSASTLTNGQSVLVNGTSNSCLGTSMATTITVNSIPIVTLTSSDADNSICLNESVTFTTGGAATYEFFINGVSQGAASATPTFTTNNLLNGQTVTVQGYSSCNAISDSSFTFVVLPLPSVNFYTSETDTTICAGQSITFTAIGANLYEFFVNGFSQGAASTTNTFITSSLPVGAPVVTVIGTSLNSCSAASATTFTVTVKPIPVIILTSSDADNTICAGTPVVYHASGAGIYQFFVNGVSQGPVSAVDSFAISSLTNGQIVSVHGKQSGCGSSGTPTYTMTVNPNPIITFSSSDADNLICYGQSVTFAAAGGSTYQLFLNGVAQGVASTVPTFIVSTLINNDFVTVQGAAAGCASTGAASFAMTVNPAPTVALTCSDADTTICSGSNLGFNASGANLYEFFINGVSQGISSPASAFSTNSITNGQIVTVIGTNNYGCFQSSGNVYTVNVNSLPSVTLTSSDADNQICLTENVTFTAGGATLYEFFINGVSEGAPGLNNTFTSTAITNGQTITVKGSTNGCIANSASSSNFNVYPYPAINLTSSEPSAIICEGQSVTFTASGANLYEFFIDGLSQGTPSAAGTYTTAAITNGQTVSVAGINVVCPSIAPQTYLFTVFTYPAVAMVSSDANNIICFGDNVIFTASGATTYEFFLNGISQGSPTTENTFVSTSLENNDVITVEGFNGNCGFVSTDTFTFTVNKMDLDITAVPPNLICQGGSISYTAMGASLYHFFVNGVSQGLASTTNTFSSTTLANGAVITFSGTNSTTSCTQPCEYEQYLNVLATPVISASGATSFCEGDSTGLASNSAFGNQWLLNGNPILNATEKFYVPQFAGVYSVDVTQGGNGTIWSLGGNINGQLGDSTLINSLTPKIIKNIDNITEIDAGNEFNIAMNTGGNVFVWGNNAFGNLGDGTFTDRNYPYQLPSVNGALAIAAGGNHSLVVVTGGVVKSFGNNTDGQLGIGNTGIANFPTAVIGLTGITAVSGGEKHSLALKSDGTVWSWGANQYGQLGDGTLLDQLSPVQVSGLTNVIAISAGNYHSMALKSDSTIWVWGNNAEGQLGTNSVTFSSVPEQVNVLGKYIAVSAGGNHSIALNFNGKVYSWGKNQFGQLGDGTTVNRSHPLAISNFNGVKKIKAGVYHTIAIKQDQSVWSWGSNATGQIGDATTIDALAPIHITAFSGAGQVAPGLNHTCVAMSNGATCVSNTMTINITPAPAVSVYDSVTFLSTDPGVSYQWYFNNSPILGGLNQKQNLIGAGYYFVQVTYANGCTVNSEIFGYMTGIESLNNSVSTKVFPNPAIDQFTIVYEGTEEINEIYLSDIVGKKVMVIGKNIAANNEIIQVNTSNLSNGVYLLHVKSKTKIITVNKVMIGKF